jgi:hypothetical protein
MPNAECRMPHAECRMPNAEWPARNGECAKPNGECRPKRVAPMIEGLGWVATAVFVGSYFCANPLALKRVQMLGALMWIAYGMLLGASPVIVANALVFAAAAWTAAVRGEND